MACGICKSLLLKTVVPPDATCTNRYCSAVSWSFLSVEIQSDH